MTRQHLNILKWIRYGFTFAPVAVLTFLKIQEMFDSKTPAEPGMPTLQFSLILGSIIAIFVIYSVIESRKTAQSPQTEPPKPYEMSADMRRFVMVCGIISLFGFCIAIPYWISLLTHGVGTRKWIEDLCLVLVLVMSIPTMVEWTRSARKSLNPA